MMNLKLYVKKNWTSLIANGLMFWILIMIFALFALLQKDGHIMKFSEDQNQIYSTLWQPIYESGMILVTGLFLMRIIKFFKKDIVVIIIGVLTILIYYWKMKIGGIS
tara:strand:- start:106 stop:426 length:321 start_codon:yes stop_codon:yes gene_type:complete